MLGYLLKVLAVLCISVFVIFLYYFIATGHNSSYSGFLGYIIFMGICYSGYRAFIQFFTRKPEKVTFKVSTLLLLFLTHLFILCCYFFQLSGLGIGGGLLLFFKILLYSLAPLCVFLISYGCGDTLLQKVPKHENESRIFQFLSALGIGFFVFITGVTICGLFGMYNIFSVVLISIILAVVGFKSMKQFYQDICNYEMEFENLPGKASFIKITSSEFLFFLMTLFISVNLISIMRPFPIGWDDLGVYMNYPNLMSQAESLLSLGSMYSWQVFTGIGFITGGATQAFFFNSIGGSIAFLVLYLIFKDLFKDTKKTLLNIPLLLVTSFAALPMVTFQLAKDMKLDLGLLFISSIAVYMTYKIILQLGSEKKIPVLNKWYLLIIGIIMGLAFTTKVTSLLLISGVFAVLFYGYLGTKGFLGYLGFYIAVFTKFGLWSYMNISYPNDSLSFVNSVSLTALGIGVGSILWSIFENKKDSLQKLIISLFIVVVGCVGAISPWLIKNISEADTISVGSLLGGKADRLVPDYGLLYSPEELDAIVRAKQSGINASGTTTNEDFGRYFGYEKGINNYLKLPVSLTMQKNQKGEFTDIGFLFLALLPTVFLFLPYRRKAYVYITLGVCVMGFFVFFVPITGMIFTDIMSRLTLPAGYMYILGVFLLWLVLNMIIDPEKKLMKLFQVNLIFALFYTFLWTLSAYGIVWYGIVMYLNFLLMIGISLYFITHYKETDNKKKVQAKVLGSTVIFTIFSIYFLMSAVPHSLNSLKGAGFVQFKNSQLSANESLFGNQFGYLEAIFTMNIAPDKIKEFLKDSIRDEKFYNKIIKEKSFSILTLINTLKAIENDEQFPVADRKNAKKGVELIYKNILAPKDDYKNKGNVFRVGTFLKYYITQNERRVLTDSLLMTFDMYIHDTDKKKTLGNFKQLGLEYILLDLNAATIDKDERKDLTRRYENMLSLLTADNLEFVTSDSICLRFALQNYKTSEKTEDDLEQFIATGGANYESYDENGKVTYRSTKLGLCHRDIVAKINTSQDVLDQEGYGFLIPLKNYLISDQGKEIAADNEKLKGFLKSYIPAGRFGLFKIK